jgi:hypothetical protein
VALDAALRGRSRSRAATVAATNTAGRDADGAEVDVTLVCVECKTASEGAARGWRVLLT